MAPDYTEKEQKLSVGGLPSSRLTLTGSSIFAAKIFRHLKLHTSEPEKKLAKPRISATS